ncbi:MAG: hypothetical protein PWQ35_618 [Patescibacteria group bacterium]|nr:hypothetical protein [Patescibacteria group bacterium]
MSSNVLKKFKDKQTLDRLKKKDQVAFTLAYDENVADIYRFVYFKIGNDEEAKDITSEVFLKTWNHIQTNSLEDAKTLRALFYKVARNTIIDHYREHGKGKIVSLEEQAAHFDIALEEEKGVEERLDIKQDIELIKAKLPLLKEEYREAIIMRFINELDLAEIADITGKSRGNIRILIHRALKALKSLLDEDRESQEKEV